MPSVTQLIVRMARKHGIDPRAALAVARGEGGLVNRERDIGDLAGGGSYGPFQLYAQGALPQRFRGNPRLADRWAWSPQGIRYAMRQMAKVGASGLTGEAAVRKIITDFERPKDVAGSIAGALSRYGGSAAPGSGAPTPSASPEPFSAPVGGGAGPAAAAPVPPRTGRGRDFALDMISQMQSGGDMAGPIEGLRATSPRPQVQPHPVIELAARTTGGTTMAPPPGPAGNELATRAVRIAAGQIGAPYIWGAESPAEGGFDCSGLIDFAYKQAGLDFQGRLTTETAMRQGRSVRGQPLQPGDMVITGTGGHMVLYAGGGRVIAAPHKGAVVRYQPLADFNILDVRRLG